VGVGAIFSNSTPSSMRRVMASLLLSTMNLSAVLRLWYAPALRVSSMWLSDESYLSRTPAIPPWA